jgi:3-isopropylmalate/(R)-2-methylmalate dehydratase small subunit
MKRFERLDAAALPITRPNCDTDQILPARFLQKLRSDGFGQYLFRDLRYRKDGSEEPGFVLNQPDYRQARIVIAQRNFACGSSREHAVWALYDYGFRAAIAPSFGDIFFSNALKNGLLPIVLPEDIVVAMMQAVLDAPGTRIGVDLQARTVIAPDGAVHEFDVDPFARHLLLNGLDELGYTLSHADRITAFERRYEAANPPGP